MSSWIDGEQRVNMLNRQTAATCFSLKTKIHCNNKQADNSASSTYFSHHAKEGWFISISRQCRQQNIKLFKYQLHSTYNIILKLYFRFQKIKISNYSWIQNLQIKYKLIIISNQPELNEIIWREDWLNSSWVPPPSPFSTIVILSLENIFTPSYRSNASCFTTSKLNVIF